MQAIRVTKITGLTLALALISSFGVLGVASATKSTAATTTQLQAVIKEGDAKIAKRLTDLDKLTVKINANTKLSATNKDLLAADVSSAKTGLTALKAKLDAETDITQAKADNNLIVTDYRVYLLIVPKINMLKVSDNQITKQAQLLAFANLLKSAVSESDKSTTLMPKVTAMIAGITATQKLSQETQAKLLALKPSDYNANHAVLVSLKKDLQTVQQSNVAAWKQGNAILKELGVTTN